MRATDKLTLSVRSLSLVGLDVTTIVPPSDGHVRSRRRADATYADRNYWRVRQNMYDERSVCGRVRKLAVRKRDVRFGGEGKRAESKDRGWRWKKKKIRRRERATDKNGEARARARGAVSWNIRKAARLQGWACGL